MRLDYTKTRLCRGLRVLLRILPVLTIILALQPVRLRAEGYADYKELPFGKTFTDKVNPKSVHAELFKALGQKDEIEQKRAELQDYYNGYMFPALTREDHAERLFELRTDLLKDLAVAEPQAREFLLGIAWKNCGLLLKGTSYHPAAQVNAALILGELNLREGNGVERGPIPYPKALGALITLATPSKKYPDPVQAAALVGIMRHVTLRAPLTKSSPGELSDADRQSITKMALEILDQKAVPPTRTIKAHDWIRRNTIEALGALKSPGPDNSVANRLIELAKDKDVSLEVRVAVVEALGAMGLKVEAVDPKALSRSVGRLLVEMIEVETQDLLLARNGVSFTPSGGGAVGPPGRGYGRSGPEGGGNETGEPKPKDVLTDPRTEKVRRRMLVWGESLNRGIVGDESAKIPGLVGLFKKSDAELLQTTLATVLESGREKELDVENLGAKLDTVLKKLRVRYPTEEPKEGDIEEDVEAVADGG